MPFQETDALLDPSNVEARLYEEQLLNGPISQPPIDTIEPNEVAVEDEDEEDDGEDKDWIVRLNELPWVQKPAPLKMAFGLFVIGVALAIGAPLKQVIMYKLACQSLIKNTPGAQCDPIQVQQLVTNYQMWENIFTPLVLIATTVQVCRMLDIYGRKFFITLFSVCLFCGEFVYYIAVSRASGFPMWWMWLGTIIALCAGGPSGVGALCKAYITDITKPKDRIYFIGLAFVGIEVGQLVGPLISSFIVKLARGNGVPGKNSNIENAIPSLELLPLKISLVMMFVFVFYNYFLLAESRSPVLRSKSRSASIALAATGPTQNRKFALRHQIVAVFRPLKILFYPEEFKTRDNKDHFTRDRTIVILLAFGESMCIVLAIVENIFSPQYGIYKYHWDSVTLSYLMFSNGLATTLLMVAVSPFLFKRILPSLGFKVNDQAIDGIDTLVIVLTTLIFALCLIGQSFAPNTLSFLGFSVAQQVYNLCAATLTAAIAKYFPSSKIGELYGAVSLAQSVTTLIIPALFSQLFSYGVRHGIPQLPFLALTIPSVGMAVVGLLMRRLSATPSIRI